MTKLTENRYITSNVLTDKEKSEYKEILKNLRDRIKTDSPAQETLIELDDIKISQIAIINELEEKLEEGQEYEQKLRGASLTIRAINKISASFKRKLSNDVEEGRVDLQDKAYVRTNKKRNVLELDDNGNPIQMGTRYVRLPASGLEYDSKGYVTNPYNDTLTSPYDERVTKRIVYKTKENACWEFKTEIRKPNKEIKDKITDILVSKKAEEIVSHESNKKAKTMVSQMVYEKYPKGFFNKLFFYPVITIGTFFKNRKIDKKREEVKAQFGESCVPKLLKYCKNQKEHQLSRELAVDSLSKNEKFKAELPTKINDKLKVKKVIKRAEIDSLREKLIEFKAVETKSFRPKADKKQSSISGHNHESKLDESQGTTITRNYSQAPKPLSYDVTASPAEKKPEKARFRPTI